MGIVQAFPEKIADNDCIRLSAEQNGFVDIRSADTMSTEWRNPWVLKRQSVHGWEEILKKMKNSLPDL
jgi:hypothetical protein